MSCTGLSERSGRSTVYTFDFMNAVRGVKYVMHRAERAERAKHGVHI